MSNLDVKDSAKERRRKDRFPGLLSKGLTPQEDSFKDDYVRDSGVLTGSVLLGGLGILLEILNPEP